MKIKDYLINLSQAMEISQKIIECNTGNLPYAHDKILTRNVELNNEMFNSEKNLKWIQNRIS